jgi:hypothetical protein
LEKDEIGLDLSCGDVEAMRGAMAQWIARDIFAGAHLSREAVRLETCRLHPLSSLRAMIFRCEGDLAAQSNLLLVGSGDDAELAGSFEERFTG